MQHWDSAAYDLQHSATEVDFGNRQEAVAATGNTEHQMKLQYGVIERLIRIYRQADSECYIKHLIGPVDNNPTLDSSNTIHSQSRLERWSKTSLSLSS